MSAFNTILQILILTMLLISCANINGKDSNSGKLSADTATVATHTTNQVMADSLIITKDELTKIYSKAIEDFIKAVYKNDGITFDTLYFGKREYGFSDDFPDIALPKTIEKTEIRLVSPEVGQTIQAKRKSLIYINMMGWIDAFKAEFILVIFSNGGEHQYDYFIKYSYNT